MKIALSPTPSQQKPEQKDPMRQELYDLYKEETGKSAIYKRGGEWNESKAFQEWSDDYLEKVQNEVYTEEEINEAKRELKKRLNLLSIRGSEAERLIKEFEAEHGLLANELSSKSQEEIDELDDERAELAIEVNKLVDEEVGTATPNQIVKGNQIKESWRLLCELYDMMGRIMEFSDKPDEKDIELLEKIDKVVNAKF